MNRDVWNTLGREEKVKVIDFFLYELHLGIVDIGIVFGIGKSTIHKYKNKEIKIRRYGTYSLNIR